MTVQIDITYEGDLHCLAKHVPSGSTITTDAPVDNGGKGELFSPTDLVATAFGCCIGTVMGLYAKKRGIDLTGTQIRVIKEMTLVPVRRIGSLSVMVMLPKGGHLSKDDRRLLENIAKVCPVRQSLHPDVKINLEFVYPD